MVVLPVDDLLAPLGDDSPCGSNLEYDPAFLALQDAVRGKAEQQFGDKIIPAQDPEWPLVYEQAIELGRRTRDLRVAVLLARSGARVHGLAAYAGALALLAGLLDRYWTQVFPLLDADDGNDPTMRLNALAPLADPATGLADLRSARIGAGPAAISVRQVELAWGKVEPIAGDTVLSQDGVVQALTAAEGASSGTLAALKQVHAELVRIETILTQQVGSAVGPDVRPLRAVTQCLASAAQRAGGDLTDGQDNSASGAATGVQSAPGAIRSREDVLRLLDRACEWVERNEPTNPAPLLIRRAQRLMNKNFLEIIQDMAPNGIEQIQNIAGAAGE